MNFLIDKEKIKNMKALSKEHFLNIYSQLTEQDYFETTKLLLENDDTVRVCSECKSVMVQGYCIEGGMAYYCTDSCLHKNVTEEEWLELYGDGDTESYWTEWEEGGNDNE